MLSITPPMRFSLLGDLVINSNIILYLTPPHSCWCLIFVFLRFGLGLWCRAPLSTIFQLYHGDQFYWCRKPAIFATGRCHFQHSNIRITKRFWLAGDDDYLRGATSINHQVALRANFKIYSRSAKGGEKGNPNRNHWLLKICIIPL
jgi:hypothetical protein